MKRKIILILIVVASLFVLTFIFSLFSKNKTSSQNTDTGTNFVSNFFNFGKTLDKIGENITNTEEEKETINENNPINEQGMRNRLIKISSVPVAGFGLYSKERFENIPDVVINNEEQKTKNKKLIAPNTELVNSIRYVAKENGFIYQSSIDDIQEKNFSGTTVQKVYEAFFADNGNSAIMRYLKEDRETIATFIGTLPKEILGADTVNTENLKGSFLPENISELTISPDKRNIFYILNTKNGIAGMISDAFGGNSINVFNSAFTEWLVSWPNKDIISLNTKPSYNTKGYMYFLNPINKNLRKILGNINGLTTLANSDGKMVLYTNNTLNLNMYNTEKKEVTNLSIRTLPEKCVFANSNNIYCSVPKNITGDEYPDTWYQGIDSFRDDIWKINTIDNTGVKIFEIPEDKDIDGIKLAVDESEKYLFLINKNDNYLWRVDLNYQN